MRGKKRSETNNLSFLEKEVDNKFKVSRRKEIIRSRVEINETEDRKLIQKINETKRWFFKGTNKVFKPKVFNPKKIRESKLLIPRMKKTSSL